MGWIRPVLRRANVITGRKDGSSVYYSVTDLRIFDLLESAKLILTGLCVARSHGASDPAQTWRRVAVLPN